MENRNYDVVILGSGPAGLQAAIHAARRKVSVLVLGKKDQSSIYHHHIENYAFLLKSTLQRAAGNLHGKDFSLF